MIAFLKKLGFGKSEGGCCGGKPGCSSEAPKKEMKAEGSCCAMPAHGHSHKDEGDCSSPKGGCC